MRSERQDAAIVLAENAVKVGYGDIPSEAVEVTKMDILDILGLALAGSTAPGIQQVRELVLEWGGKAESTIIANGSRVPAPNAALLNATMAHARDYDDTHDSAVVHAGVSAISSAFAIAERTGKVDGKALITAVTLGIDLMCRLGLANRLGPAISGWHNTAIYGVFGSAVTVGKLLGLGKEGMVNALGLAYCQAAGNTQCIRDGALSKRLQPGLAAKAAVFSALLAEKGFTGSRNSLEDKAGLFQVYHRGDYDPAPLTAELGKRFEAANLSFKPYPCCRLTHTSIDATLGLVREHGIRPEEVEKVTVFIGENTRLVCEPREARIRPQGVVDAQFSLPYTVATAIVKNKLGIQDFTVEAIQEPLILQLAQKVVPRLTPELTSKEIEAVIVEIHTNRDNGVFSKRVDFAKGSPKNPMSWEELAEKFRDCASFSAKPLARDSLEQAIAMIKELQAVDDVSRIIRLLA